MNIRSEQTPRNYTKIQNYTSPIGLLKNYTSTINTGGYQQQFYKIKTQRLQYQIQELKQENLILKFKLNQSYALGDGLKDKVFWMEKQLSVSDRSSFHKLGVGEQSNYSYQYNSGPSDSKFLTVGAIGQRSQRLAHNTEIERLVKQNRMLKNQREIEINQLKDENKKLNRKVNQLQSLKPIVNQNQQQEKKIKVRLEERNQKLEKNIHELRKDYEQLSKQRNKLQEKLKIIEENNRALRRQGQQLKQRESEKIELLVKDHIIQLQRVKHQYESRVLKQQKQKQSQRIKKEFSESKENDKSNEKKEITNEISMLKRKILLDEKIIKDKDDQIKNILIKLKPLLENSKKQGNKLEKDGEIDDFKKGSFSILEMFFKKYKINLF